MLSRGLAILLLALWSAPGTTLSAQTPHQQHHPPENANEYIRSLEDPGREEWQQPERVVEALGLTPGEAVADLGAGSGYFTVRLARAVGPTGKVYAVDVEQAMLDYLTRRAKQEQLANIQPVLAGAHDPRLPPASVDVIFICDTLHHISDRATYYPLLLRALKPGGRLVNVDFKKNREITLGPPFAMRIAQEDCAKEIEVGGFKLIQEFDFLKNQYFLVFQRP